MNDKHNEPQHWKLGIFYFNLQDKRIFVPKRISALGLTLNFANPYAGLILITSIILLILIPK